MPETQKKDILEYLQCMVNTETPTPLRIVNKMLDLIPNDVWLDDNAKILCPACKDGIFLRETVIRILRAKHAKLGGYEFGIRQNEILNHILRNRIFGIAISYRGYRVTKRTLYTCREDFADIDNIFFDESLGEYVKDKSGAAVEKQAFHFIKNQPEVSKFFASKGVENMKFDVIIGNPPYQLNTTSSSAQAIPLYNKFVEQALELNPKYISMIIPSRWYAGGIGLENFRNRMLNDDRINVLVDYLNADECFKNIELRGGCCYFLWDGNKHGPCAYSNIINAVAHTTLRRLNEYDIFVRYNQALGILQKIQFKTKRYLSAIVSPVNPFGIPSSVKGGIKSAKFNILLHSSKGIGYISQQTLKGGQELVRKYKVLLSRPISGNMEIPPFKVMALLKVLSPNEVCTHTYLTIGAFDSKEQAENLKTYLETRFVRFLLLLSVSGMDISKDKFRFVPMQDFNEAWDDKKLYKKYGLSAEEINFIESMVKPME